MYRLLPKLTRGTPGLVLFFPSPPIPDELTRADLVEIHEIYMYIPVVYPLTCKIIQNYLTLFLAKSIIILSHIL